MKPIIMKMDDKGNILTDEKELRRLIDETYDEGYKDGQRSMRLTWTYPGNINGTGDASWIDKYKYEVTCGTNEETTAHCSCNRAENNK